MTSGTPSRMAAWLESAWLARYLDRQLEGEELAWFEAYLLDKPELVKAVEVDNKIRAASALLRAHGDAVDAERIGGPLGYAARARLPRMAIAASLMLSLGAAAGWLAGRETGREALVASATRIVFDTTRGLESTPAVEHSNTPTPYVLVEVAVPAGTREATISVPGSETLTVNASSDGFVTFLCRECIVGGASAQIRYRAGGRDVSRTLELPHDDVRRQ